ncbi:hypothetical protein DPMN_016376 [Dreissena polymorpha]|uniref:Uncharacterized protein n=1 Tax=Dreissena polymorpha TaxID=45954 RepID=A0A9D4S5G4_DREPO|nr:hypothetical protein DPMN_016376 [Dreissena polymorpha]
MRRPLDEEAMQMLDFRPNPRLFAITLEEDEETHEEDMGRLFTGESVSHKKWGLGAHRNRLDAREKAELAAEINTLEEGGKYLRTAIAVSRLVTTPCLKIPSYLCTTPVGFARPNIDTQPLLQVKTFSCRLCHIPPYPHIYPIPPLDVRNGSCHGEEQIARRFLGGAVRSPIKPRNIPPHTNHACTGAHLEEKLRRPYP